MTLIDFDAYVQRAYQLAEQKAEQQEKMMNNSGKAFPHQTIKMR